MSVSPDEYFSFIKEYLAPLYLKVKKTIIEAETYDQLKRAYVAPFNELRNTLDHVMKGALCDDQTETMKNLSEAKVHLNRAGYDVYEIVTSNLAIYIAMKIEKYSIEIVSTVFPDYYEKIQPQLIEIQNELIEVRSKKNVDDEIDPEPFDIYEKNKTELINIYKLINDYIPLLEKARKKNKVKWFLNNIVWGIIIGIVGAVIAGIIMFIIFKQ